MGDASNEILKQCYSDLRAMPLGEELKNSQTGFLPGSFQLREVSSAMQCQPPPLANHVKEQQL